MASPVTELEQRLQDERKHRPDSPELAAFAADLAWELAVSDPERSRALSAEAARLAERHDLASVRARVYRNTAFLHRMAGAFDEAIRVAGTAASLFDALGDAVGGAEATDTLASCYLDLGALDSALEHALHGLELARSGTQRRTLGWATIGLGRVHLALGEYDRASQLVREALAVFEELGHTGGVARALGLLGDLATTQGDVTTALGYLERAHALWRELGAPRGQAASLISRARVLVAIDPRQALEIVNEIERIMGVMPLPDLEFRVELIAASALLRLGRLDEAARVAESARTHAEARRSVEHEAEAEAILEELWEQRGDPARALAHAKRRREREGVAREAATAERARNLQLSFRAAVAEREATVTDRLLHGTLPAAIVRELKLHGRVEPVHHDHVTVLFADLVGFTGFSARVTPRELVAELDALFSTFDDLVARHRLEKVKTIGDAYMALSGAPTPRHSHAIRAVLAALELRDAVAARVAKRPDSALRIRIGLHSGPVVAGVIGQDKLAYDVWGDTVNTASRMESSGVAGEINISRSTYELVAPYCECAPRGLVEAKGKGQVEMFLVRRLLPTWAGTDDGGRANTALLAALDTADA